MSFIHFDATTAASAGGAIVSVSGETIGSAGVGSQLARLDFLAVGTVFKFETSSGNNQIDSATDWIIPNGAASSDYDVRYINLSGDAFTFSAASENTWIDLGSDRSWGYIDSNPAPFELLFGFATFQIRLGPSGPVLDSATYTLAANRTS